jgi:hypothetical protein
MPSLIPPRVLVVSDSVQFNVSILNSLIPPKVTGWLDNGAGSRRSGWTEDVHNRVLKSLPLFWIVIVAEDPMMVKDSNDIVRIHDAPESAGLLEFKLID